MLTMSPAQSVGITIKELERRMKANDIADRHQLAALLGVNQSTVFRWLKGTTAITIGMAALIAAKLPKAK